MSLPVSISDLPAQASQSSNEVSTVVIGQDRLTNVVQAAPAPRDTRRHAHFAPGHGLRPVRYNPSPIGRVPTQVDYGDYRDVGGKLAVSDALCVDGRARRNSTERDPDPTCRSMTRFRPPEGPRLLRSRFRREGNPV